MTVVSTVPFNKIKSVDEINARPKGRDGIDELAASIKARGLIQPLAVRPNDQDHYEVIDGRRRFMAIGRLVKAGDWEKTALIPIIIRHEDDAAALETSLIANTVRLPMHPVDQHEVFARLVDQGREPQQIAADFGVTEKTVRQQLALGKLSPEVRKAWKAGKIDAPSAQAFTTADAVQQAAILKRLSGSYYRVTADAVRRELQTERPAAKDVEPAVLALYLGAGGTVGEDLFSDARYIDDAKALADAKASWLDGIATQARLAASGQGWAWVATDQEVKNRHWQWKIIHADLEAPDDVADEMRALEHKIAKTKDVSEKDALYHQIERLDLAWRVKAHTPAERARSGVVIIVDRFTGGVEFQCGVIRPDADGQVDLEVAIDDTGDDDGDRDEHDNLPSVGAMVDGEADEPARDPFMPSAALLEDITRGQSRAAATALRRHPELALRFAVAALMSNAGRAKPVELLFGQTAVGRGDSSVSFVKTLEAAMSFSSAGLMDEFADLVGRALDLVQHAYDGTDRRAADAALLAQLPAGDYLEAMRAEFVAEDYFKRSTKQTAIASIAEMRAAGHGDGLAPADVLADMKKGELAEVAARQARASGWLPPQLRHPEYTIAWLATPARAKKRKAA